MTSGVLNRSYIDEFHMMEASGLLDQLNRIHLLSLYLVLLQQINKSLQKLTNSSNSNNNNNNNNSNNNNV